MLYIVATIVRPFFRCGGDRGVVPLEVWFWIREIKKCGWKRVWECGPTCRIYTLWTVFKQCRILVVSGRCLGAFQDEHVAPKKQNRRSYFRESKVVVRCVLWIYGISYCRWIMINIVLLCCPILVPLFLMWGIGADKTYIGTDLLCWCIIFRWVLACVWVFLDQCSFCGCRLYSN